MAPMRKRKKPDQASRVQKSRPPSGTKTGTAAPQLPDPGQAPVVGIGASAGGLEALKSFFGAMPPKSGLVFVVVVHLDPTHESLMPELLAKCTALAVKHAQDRQPLEADCVYVIPPNRHLTLDQGLLRVKEPADRRSLRGAIDHFFRSLAEDQHERAIGVVLSGTGTEGALGVRAIKAEGGLVMAQAPETAGQPGMPTSAIATGLIDLVLPPHKMPKALLEYVSHPYLRGAGPAALPEEKPIADGLNAIVALLRAHRKYDFHGYKKGTLRRRVERRMGLQHVKDFPTYVNFLRTHPAEVERLFKDLLIEVTAFFRDVPAFEELATTVIAPLAKAKHADAPIRVWVPGCATGEEAYSLAILVAEQMARAQSPRAVQIFATDVDDEALEVARAGTYSETIALDVTPQRLQRFFTHEDHRYKVVKSIRESVVFAVQNLISDPPFSKLDLVSCRNVLIYLEPDIQRKLIAMFHFALSPGGHLFLGTAESPGQLDELFTPISKRWRIYRRVGTALHQSIDVSMPAADAVMAKATGVKVAPEPTVMALGEHQLLEHFAPAAVIINHTGQILHLYGAMKRYLQVSSGAPTHDVATLTRDPLKATVHAAMQDAIRHNRRVSLETFQRRKGRRPATVRITVAPVKGSPAGKSLWLVIFEELPPPPSVSTRRATSGARDVVRRLEAELRAAKTDQQNLIEQLGRSNEDQKAANEEVTSMNEELQSTNEELQSSKEELQSMNEELSTVNAQLHEKVQELTTVNDDLTNLFTATDIAMVFVDAEFRISRFTAAATRLLNLIPSDVGRPIGHLATNLVDLALPREAEAVLRSGEPVERAVDGRDGRHYIVRILPYEREGKRPEGVVVTFIDVTTLKKSERELLASRRYVEEIAGLNQQALADLALDALMTRCVNTTAELFRIECVEVFEHDAAAGTLTSRAAIGKPANAGPMVAWGSPEGAALTAGQTVTMTGLQADARFATNTRVRERGLESGIVVIIRRNGDLWGVLAAFSTAARAFQADEVHFLEAVANTLGTALTRVRGERALHLLTETLEKRIAERTKWLTLTHDVTQIINEAATWDEAVRRVMRHLCETERWQVGYVYVADKEASETIVPAIVCSAEERFRPFHLASQAMRFARGQCLPGLVYGDGKPIWLDDQEGLLKMLPFRAAAAKQVGLRAAVAVPVIIGSETIAVLELLSDQPHPPSEDLLKLMIDIATHIGKVVDRERLMGQVADMVWREQQNLLHTLHDSLGQQLTGLGMLSTSLYQQFKGKDETAATTAAQVSDQAKQALELVRQLSKGLFPVEIDAAGLTHGLQQLASTTENLYKIACRVEGDGAVLVHDNRIATELYRIAQEAVTNALKHADAHTISLRLSAEAGIITLKIADDGIGIGSRAPNSAGMGLRIMRFRALSIGANVSVEPGATGGTVVTCTLREAPHMAATPRAEG